MLHYLMNPTVWLFFIAAFGCTVILTPLVIWLARLVGIVEKGDHRRINVKETPLMGGLAIAIPFVVACCLGFTKSFAVFFHGIIPQDILILVVGCISITALGVIDDAFYLRARIKLLVQVLIASLIFVSSHTLTHIYVPFIGEVTFSAWIGGTLSIIWIVGLINAFNLIDGIDGLASGVALIAAITLAILGAIVGNVFVMVLFLALGGSLLGFLLFNFHPAKIFLGDTGSMFLGYTIAMLTLMGSYKSEMAVIVLAPLLTLGLPIFETFVSIIRRYLRGIPIFASDSLHTHHRLLSRGYSQRSVVLILYSVSLLLASWAIIDRLLSPKWGWIPLSLFILTLAWIAWLAGYLRPKSFNKALQRRQHNALLNAFSKYIVMSFNAHRDTSNVQELLLRMCQIELRLKLLRVQTDSGQIIFDTGTVSSGDPTEKFKLGMTGGQGVEIMYQFNYAANELEKQDATTCLANIFSQIRI